MLVNTVDQIDLPKINLWLAQGSKGLRRSFRGV
jgi:hypothetical protein